MLVYLLERPLACVAEKVAHHPIARGIPPVDVRLAIPLEIVQRAPGVVDVRLPEPVAVVPLACLRHAVAMAEVAGELKRLSPVLERTREPALQE